jgi:hypothetical protein
MCCITFWAPLVYIMTYKCLRILVEYLFIDYSVRQRYTGQS